MARPSRRRLTMVPTMPTMFKGSAKTNHTVDFPPARLQPAQACLPMPPLLRLRLGPRLILVS